MQVQSCIHDDSVFFTPKSLVKRIVNIIEPKSDILLDPDCGSGGMFIQSGDEANTFYHDAYNLDSRCDYVMVNPPFNVDKVKAESYESAGCLPFGMRNAILRKQKRNMTAATYQ